MCLRGGVRNSSLFIFITAAVVTALVSLTLQRYFSPNTMTTVVSSPKAPVWFVAHGGPPTLFDVEHSAHQHWLQLAKDFRQSNLKGIVFVSAHWQAEEGDFVNAASKQQSTSILINTNESNPLIYDFYNFPKHYYDTRFETKNPKHLNEAVYQHLEQEGYHVEKTDRGIDHGVWVPLRASGESMDIPLVQVSLPIAKDPLYDGIAALRLGRALKGLRERGYAIIGGGQSVHNLRDYMGTRYGHSVNTDYGKIFSNALTQALAQTGNGEVTVDGDAARWDKAKALFMRPEYLRAHPTSEHLLPVLVALGAAEESEAGIEEFAMDDGPLNWNMYRFG